MSGYYWHRDPEDPRTDEARWRAAGKPEAMTLEQRAEYIASCGRRGVGGVVWGMIRARALEQLREVETETLNRAGAA